MFTTKGELTRVHTSLSLSIRNQLKIQVPNKPMDLLVQIAGEEKRRGGDFKGLGAVNEC